MYRRGLSARGFSLGLLSFPLAVPIRFFDAKRALRSPVCAVEGLFSFLHSVLVASTEEGRPTLNHVILTASAVLVMVLVLLLCREVRLRRALQRLLTKLMSFWRNNNAENAPTVPSKVDDGPAAGSGLL